MSVTADPAERFGDHVVLQITVPVRWVVFEHHHRDVKIELDRLRSFAKRWGQDVETFRYQVTGFSWMEEIVMQECGWCTHMSNGMLWPTRSLVDSVADWETSMGIR